MLTELIRRFGSLPVWGVVSTYAADSYYPSLTYDEARTQFNLETREEGRSARIVLEISPILGEEP